MNDLAPANAVGTLAYAPVVTISDRQFGWHIGCKTGCAWAFLPPATGEMRTMGDYVFMMKLDTDSACMPQIRIWIDDELSGDLASEREVSLVRESEDSWGARFEANGDAFTYRIGICATPGTTWTLSFRSGDDGDELLFDSDRLTVSKEWLLGTCELSDQGAPSRLALAGASSVAS